MELVKKRKRLTEPESQYYMQQILQATVYMHNSNVIHRDLKLGNLFLDKKMEVKIGDFGLATRLSHSEEKKRTICGTPNYIAPEMLEGRSHRGHSFAVDIWSLGVILYTFVVGKPPYETSDVKTTYKRIRANAYSFPDHVVLSPQVKDLIRSILVVDPEKRPSLQTILAHPWFTQNNIPRSLPTSALTMPPNLEVLENRRLGAASLSGALTSRGSGDTAATMAVSHAPGASGAITSRRTSPASKHKHSKEAVATENGNGNVFSSQLQPRSARQHHVLRPSSASGTSSNHRSASPAAVVPMVGANGGANEGTTTASSSRGPSPQRAQTQAGNFQLKVEELRKEIEKLNARPLTTTAAAHNTEASAVPSTYRDLYRRSRGGTASDSHGAGAGGAVAGGAAAEPPATARAASSGRSGTTRSSRSPSGARTARSTRSGGNHGPSSSSSSAAAPRRSDLASRAGASAGASTSRSRSASGRGISRSRSRSKSPASIPTQAWEGTSKESTTASTAHAAHAKTTFELAVGAADTAALRDMAKGEDRAGVHELDALHRTLEVTFSQQQQQQQQAQQSSKTASTLSSTDLILRPPPYWVSKWVDYSNKYGLGYQLCDGSIGVYFNDASKIILNAAETHFEYLENKRSGTARLEGCTMHGEGAYDKHCQACTAGAERSFHPLDNFPAALQKKVTLLKHFRNYLKEHAHKSSLQLPGAVTLPQVSDMTYLKKWLRTRHAIIFRLSNKTVQVNFYDHTKVILSSEAQVVTYVNKQRECSTHRLATVVNEPLPDLISRLRYTKDILYQLINRGAARS
jgi:serine/threonine protein kinase